MAHLAFICMPAAGHINPMAALARELVRRGHRATFVHHPDVGPLVERQGLAFESLGDSFGPPGSLNTALGVAGRVKGLSGMRALVRLLADGTRMLCEELPDVLQALGVDLIVCDGIEAAGGLVAQRIDAPFVSVAAALPLNWEPGIPSPFLGWSYGETRWHRTRNIAAQHAAQMMQAPLHTVIRAYSEAWGLGPYFTVQHFASGYAQIAQLTPSLDYPRRALIGCFHYCGPLRTPRAADRPPTPSDATLSDATPSDGISSDGKARAFASLGSLQGHRFGVFVRIAEASAAAGLALTIAHGGLLSPAEAARLSRLAEVRDFVAYDEIFERTDVAILHAGMNGVLDALAHGVPIVAIPLAYEQAAIAARVRRAGVGTVCRPRDLSRRLAGAIREVHENPAYAAAAGRMREEIRAAGGVRRAADIVEQVARSGKPCLNAAAAGDADLAGYGLGTGQYPAG